MATVQPPALHIPAWKRIGLKLKNAKDEPGPISNLTAAHVPGSSKKRKVVDGRHADKHAKKAKKSDSKPPDTSLVDGGSDQKDGISAVATQGQSHYSLEPKATPVLPKAPTIAKRKSVTFAPEAKTADGDSTKDLYDRWLASQKITDAEFDPTTTPPALKIHSPVPKPQTSLTTLPSREAINVQKKKKKKKKKRKTKSKSTTLKPGQSLTSPSQSQPGPPENHADTQPHPALLYLTEYHTSPSTWKFSKNHQKYLLKNLFSFDKVPSSYEPALQAYLTGLKGTSARQSLREAALRIRKEDNMWLSEIIAKGRSPEWEAKRRREQYERAWKREKDRLEETEDLREWDDGEQEFEWKAQKRRRAEQVLRVIGEVETQLANGGMETFLTAGNAGTPGARKHKGEEVRADGGGPMVPAKKKKKRTRKRRTTGVPDDEDSSSSSSSSSSDSDSEDQIEKRVREGLGTSKRTNKSPPASRIGRSTIDSDEDESSSEDSQSSSGDSESSSGSGSDDDDKKR